MILERELMEEEYIIGFNSNLTMIKYGLYEISYLVGKFNLITEAPFFDTTLRDLYENRDHIQTNTIKSKKSQLEKTIRTNIKYIEDFTGLITKRQEDLIDTSINFKILEGHTQKSYIMSRYLTEYISKKNNSQNYQHNFQRFIPALESSIESYNKIFELKNFYDTFIDKRKAIRNLFPHLDHNIKIWDDTTL
ncbi:hypothetical protein HN385_05620 [archaeon]|jgi:hypothetical protein|nr:hypothetical protein [archaeon]MBT3451476.1 hypothetical protein [archaeon]MBT6868530.1 hypothetical protein [archaeon]MBT7193064.1 hypothetical protein [archaeon]MBT7381153.1 hypothetical protein [archaeon]